MTARSLLVPSARRPREHTGFPRGVSLRRLLTAVAASPIWLAVAFASCCIGLAGATDPAVRRTVRRLIEGMHPLVNPRRRPRGVTRGRSVSRRRIVGAITYRSPRLAERSQFVFVEFDTRHPFRYAP
jgi:hypothetical protein